MRGIGYAWLAGYVATILAANWTLARVGVVRVAGLGVPAGVVWAGLAFTARDLVQDTLGKRAVGVAIGLGTVASALVSPQLALASGSAFLVSELADFAVYTPLRERGRWLWAVAASNTVGLVLDSGLFLVLAFGPLWVAYLPGQIAGKTLMTLAVLPLLWWAQRRRGRPLGRVAPAAWGGAG